MAGRLDVFVRQQLGSRREKTFCEVQQGGGKRRIANEYQENTKGKVDWQRQQLSKQTESQSTNEGC